MKIKELLANFDKEKYGKIIELFQNEHDYNLQSAYLCQLIMLSFLEQNNLIESLDYYNHSLTHLLESLKIESKEDIEREFFRLYDRECTERYLHFSYNIKKIGLDHRHIPNFQEFIYNWFYSVFFNKPIGLNKKDLRKILNTII